MKRCGKKGRVFLVTSILAIVLGLVLLFGFNTFNTGHVVFDGGDGSSGSPYQISTCEQLQGIEDEAQWGSNYILVSDIDCYNTRIPGASIWGSEGFNPIFGNYPFFNGNLDGQGNRIEGLYINRPLEGDVGLFGGVGPGNTVENIIFVNLTIFGDNAVGGLMGNSIEAIVKNITFEGVVQGDSYVGGLIGILNGGVLYNSSFFGGVSGNGYVGGLIGDFSGSPINISNTYFVGNVTGDNSGGIVGSSSNDGNIYFSYSVPAFFGASSFGGVCSDDSGNSFLTYYDTNISNISDSNCGSTPKSSSEMALQLTFAGWDFTNIWKISEGLSYPCFIWQESCPLLAVSNVAPNLTQVFISPNSSVSESDNLSGYCNATDADADNVTYYYNWYLGGALNTSGLTSSQTQAELINVNNVSSSLTSKDQNWTLECIANDGTENSTAVNSTTVTIGNTAPVVSNVAISPSPIYYYQDAECTYTFSDADSDSDSSTIKWYVNDLEVQSGSSVTLSSSYLYRGNPIYCSVTGNDGTVSISSVDSETLTVQGSSSAPAGGSSSDTPTTTEDVTTTQPADIEDDKKEDVPEKPKEDIKELILSRTGFSDSQGGIKKVSNVLKDIREEPVAAIIVLSLMLLLLLLLILLYFVIRKYVKFRNELKGKKNREDTIVKKKKQISKEGFLSRMTSKWV